MRPVRTTDAHKTDGAGRARLLQLVPLRRPRDQRRRPAARGDAPARLADHALRRRQPGAGRRRARGRPRRLLGSRHGRARGASADRDRARGDRRAAARRTGTASSSRPAPSPRRRSPTAIRALTGEDALAFFDAIAPIVHRDFDRHVGRLVPVALRQGRARRHRRRLHQLPDRRASNTTPSSTRWSPATRPRSTNGKPRRPISTAACRSR